MFVGSRLEKVNIVTSDFCFSASKTNFTDHHIPDTIHGFSIVLTMVLEIQFRPVKCTAVTVRYAKIEHFHSFPSSDASDCNGRLFGNKPLQNAFKRIQHYIYLCKLYSISIILLLKNNLTNICSRTSKVGMNFWIVYTCNMKLKKEESENIVRN